MISNTDYFIDSWKKLLNDFKNHAQLIEEWKIKDKERQINEYANSIFQRAKEMAERPMFYGEEDILQHQFVQLDQIYQTLNSKSDLMIAEKGLIKDKEKFFALSTLAECAYAFVNLTNMSNQALGTYGNQDLTKICEVFKKSVRFILENSSSKVCLQIKELLSIVQAKGLLGSVNLEERALEGKIISNYLQFLEIPRSMLENSAFHNLTFFQAMEALEKLFKERDEVLTEEKFLAESRNFLRYYANEVLKDCEVGGYLLRKSSRPNLFAINEKGEHTIAYFAIAISIKQQHGVENYLIYYDNKTGNCVVSAGAICVVNNVKELEADCRRYSTVKDFFNNSSFPGETTASQMHRFPVSEMGKEQREAFISDYCRIVINI